MTEQEQRKQMVQQVTGWLMKGLQPMIKLGWNFEVAFAPSSMDHKGQAILPDYVLFGINNIAQKRKGLFKDIYNCNHFYSISDEAQAEHAAYRTVQMLNARFHNACMMSHDGEFDDTAKPDLTPADLALFEMESKRLRKKLYQ